MCFEEHISLEEISSDSNDELNKPKKKKKRNLKRGKKFYLYNILKITHIFSFCIYIN